MTVTDIRSALDNDIAVDDLAARLVPLREALVRAIGKVSSAPVDQDIHIVVDSALNSFFSCGCSPRVAAAQVAAPLRAVGAAQARAGARASHVQLAFVQVHATVMANLPLLLNASTVGDPVVQLRLRAKEYLHALCAQTVAGLQAERRRESQERDRERALTGSRPAAVNGDRTGLVRAVVAVHDELPDAVRLDPAAHSRRSAFEVLLPERIRLDDLGAGLKAQVVYGPLTTWADMPDALALVWRAASIVRERGDDRLLIPCEELVGDLLLNGNGVLQSLLINKHLAELASMSPARRADLSETLLHWLERGLPVNQLARELGLPPQTLHSRLKNLRDVFGDRLDDPTQRLELIVALRAVVPQWRRRTAC